ncbi:hypothetical protein EVAR_61681_1 [Eumeta japonica]|uniref:Uncharacterized protein n=1 Tax=Eumeta variegata TaxID=151549 RepID=A0A4C1YQY1_EUMVA|nr:hypothetical protein EVAR_61681_1 [Eumeta japonica]
MQKKSEQKNVITLHSAVRSAFSVTYREKLMNINFKRPVESRSTTARWRGAGGPAVRDDAASRLLATSAGDGGQCRFYIEADFGLECHA